MVGFFYFFLKKERTKKAYFYSFILRLRNISPDLHSRLAVFPFFIFYFLYNLPFLLSNCHLFLFSFFLFSFFFLFFSLNFFFLSFFPIPCCSVLIRGNQAKGKGEKKGVGRLADFFIFFNSRFPSFQPFLFLWCGVHSSLFTLLCQKKSTIMRPVIIRTFFFLFHFICPLQTFASHPSCWSTFCFISRPCCMSIHASIHPTQKGGNEKVNG